MTVGFEWGDLVSYCLVEKVFQCSYCRHLVTLTYSLKNANDVLGSFLVEMMHLFLLPSGLSCDLQLEIRGDQVKMVDRGVMRPGYNVGQRGMRLYRRLTLSL